MKVIISGSKGFDNYPLLKEVCDQYFDLTKVKELLSCNYLQVDKLGEQYAKENNIPIKVFKPNWDSHGNRAVMIRNLTMAEDCDLIIYFKDKEDKSKGAIAVAGKDYGVRTEIIKY